MKINISKEQGKNSTESRNGIFKKYIQLDSLKQETVGSVRDMSRNECSCENYKIFQGTYKYGENHVILQKTMEKYKKG